MAGPPGRVGKKFYNSVALGVVGWDILGLLAD